MTPLLIFPFGGNSVEALDCIDESRYQIIGFVDDDPAKIATKYCGIEVFDRTAFERFGEAKVLACIGSPYNYKRRGEIIAGLHLAPDRFVTIIHPSAKISKFATIGKNCLMMAGVVVTHNAKIGDNAIVLPNSVIHHDVEIGENTFIAAGVVICGGVKIGQNCFIGAGARIIQNVSIGENVMVGLGSTVTENIEANTKFVKR